MGFEPVIPISTIWGIEIVRAGKVVKRWEQGNVLTNQGLDHMLNAVFHGGTPVDQWYMALFSPAYVPLVTDKYATPGYTESLAYAEKTRPPFVEGPASNKTLSNILNRAEFTMNANVTIYGLSLVGGGSAPEVKGDVDSLLPPGSDNGGILFCASVFPSPQAVKVSDVIRVSCTIILEDL